MKKRDAIRRMICFSVACILCVISAPYSVGAQASASSDTCACIPECTFKPLLRPVHCVQETVSQASYMMDAAMDELDGLVQYAAGNDPTADKPIEAEGQNTKRNTATTVIDVIQKMRPVSSFCYQLLPYAGQKDVWEVCCFYTPLFSKEQQVIHTGMLHDYAAQTIRRADGTGILGIGYDFNFSFDTFYAADDPWQRNFGFCPLYDSIAFLIGDFCKTIRVPFAYDGKDWMIQIWKGVYSGNMLGAEIGLYHKPADRQTQFYDCASDPERIAMSFTVYLGDTVIVEPEQKTAWWQTAFTYHCPVRPSDLTLCGKLTFQNTAMANAFAESLAAQNSAVQIRKYGKTVEFTW